MALRALACFALVLAVGCRRSEGQQASRTGSSAPRVPAGWSFTLPDGDPSAGKTLFFDRLACNSCHHLTVPGVTSKPGYPRDRPGYGAIGPDLDGYAALPKEYLADSLIRAHSYVAAPGYTVREDGPKMGSYNHLLVVQELIDLVAFLRTPR